MILVNIVLVHCASGVIGGSFSFVGSFCLVELCSSLFGACGPWLLSLMEVDSC